MVKRRENRTHPELSKYWCFTHNNASVNERYEEITEHTNWAIFQYEEGAAGTPHMQGVVALKKQARLVTIKGMFKANVHLEVTRNIIASVQYCSKEKGRIAGPFIIGVIPDLEKINSRLGNKRKVADQEEELLLKEVSYLNDCILKRDMDYVDIYNEKPKLAMKHAIYIKELIKKTINGKPSRCSNVYYCFGEPGTGKSYLFKQLSAILGEKPYYNTSIKGWWNGYNGEKLVIIDEFKNKGYTPQELNNILDGNTKSLAVKNGFVESNIENIVFISNFSPKFLFKDDTELNAFLRRIQNILETKCVVDNKISLNWIKYDTSYSPKKVIFDLDLEFLKDNLREAYLEIGLFISGLITPSKFLYLDIRKFEVLDEYRRNSKWDLNEYDYFMKYYNEKYCDAKKGDFELK